MNRELVVAAIGFGAVIGVQTHLIVRIEAVALQIREIPAAISTASRRQIEDFKR